MPCKKTSYHCFACDGRKKAGADRETFETFKAKVLTKSRGIKDDRLREQKLEQVLNVLHKEEQHGYHDERPDDRS